MAKLFLFTSKTLKATVCIFLLAITLGFANSARLLDEVTDPTVIDNPDVAPAVASGTTALPSGQTPAVAASTTAPVEDIAPVADPAVSLPAAPAPVVAPTDTEAPVAAAADVPDTVATPVANVAPVATPAAAASTGGAAAVATGGAAGGNPDDHPTLSFFMHDILGGSHPSGRVVTGIVTNTDANGVPFSKPNDRILPISGGVPLNTINNVINNNNVPFLVGLNGSPANTLLQNSGNNDVVNANNNQPFVTAGQLPAGVTLQQIMFGSVTVVDNEITEGHELGTAVLGRAQGFYLASSLDGSSHTLALTTLFHNKDHHEEDDTISFFGIHRTATPISHLAIIGGTGMYENAKGYATIETLQQVDQHTTDGVETITHFTVYITP